MASSSGENPVLSVQKSDSDLHVILHPLVILSISDYVTRHTLRQQSCPLVGGILGQQNGREITMEHAFDVKAEWQEDGSMMLDQDWFTVRLDQMKTVHKDRNLDLVGWYTLLPHTGPTPHILNLHSQILAFNESAALLGFHPEEVATSAGGRFPLTIYETIYESDETKRDGGGGSNSVEAKKSESEDKEMKDGEGAGLQQRFRELPYSVETDESEMISVHFVASAGNATAAGEQQKLKAKGKPVAAAVKGDAKGKRRAVAKSISDLTQLDTTVLSREDEELVASLTTKANAIRMMHSRIRLIIKYLESLPPSYLANTPEERSTSEEAAADGSAQYTTPSPTILRSIQALVNRIPLLVPSSADAFEEEMLSEANDVNLISLLNEVMQSANELRDLGKKYYVVDQAKAKGRGDATPVGLSGLAGGQSSFSSINAGDLLV